MKLLLILVVAACIAGTAKANNAPGLTFSYYEGTWDSLPNFFDLIPVKKGITANIDLGVRDDEVSYGFLWQGIITIPVTGDYTFDINADDGSKLYIGTYDNSTTPLVSVDYVHAPITRSGTIHLIAGAYPFTLTYFQNDGGQLMEVYWASNTGLAREKIPDIAFSNSASSLSFRYYEGNWNELPDFNSLTPVKTGSGSNMDLSVRERDKDYGITWKGFITIPEDGNYTFETNSDDGSKLYLDTGRTVIVDNDGVHANLPATGNINLSAGTYPFMVSFFQNSGGQQLEVYWSSNTGISRNIIPDIAFVNLLAVVNYSCYEGLWNTLPDFNTLIPFKKGWGSNINLNGRSRDAAYGMMWKSFINIPATGDYTFETSSTDGSKVFIDNSILPLVDNDGIHDNNTATGTIHLKQGPYPITVMFFQNGGGNTMDLYWSSNSGVARQKIPDSAFTFAVDAQDGSDIKGIHNYYFSTSKGNDSRTSKQAQNPATPWKTIKKLNAFFSSLLPGDAVLFKRGDVFDGSIIIGKSGLKDSSITFSAYGAGNKPIINGFAPVTGWASLGDNKYEAPLLTGGYLNLLTINNVVKAKGRYPNTDYLTIDSRTTVDAPSPVFTGPGTFTDAELPASENNWTGAEVVIRKNDYVLDKCLITGHSGTTISYNSPSPHTPNIGYGYFIQNDIRTLDTDGEWFYDVVNHKVVIYSTVDPSTLSVKGGIISSLVVAIGKSHVIFDNLEFQGSDTSVFNFTIGCSNITVQNCDINYSGIGVLHAFNADSLTFTNNNIHNTNSPCIYVVDCTNVLLKDNTIRNVGLMPGMGISNFAGHGAIYVKGSNNTVEKNIIDSIGYNGIVITGGSNIVVKNNYVNNFCMLLSDGAGIYTNGDDNFVGRRIIGNIITNGEGSYKGTTATEPRAANGIYLDELGSNVEVANNTIYNCISNGIYLHQAYDNIIRENTLVNNGITAISIVDDMPATERTHNNLVKGNILYAKTSTQKLINHSSTANDLTLFGKYDSNYYCRPFDLGGYIATHYKNPGDVYSFYDLGGWNNIYKDRGTTSFESPAITEYVAINPGVNRIANGIFQDNVNGLSSDGNTDITMDAKLDGNAAKFMSKPSPTGGDIGAVIDIGSVVTGTTYRVKFSLIGSSYSKNMTSYVRSFSDPDYKIVSDIKYFPMKTTRTECEYLYRVMSNEDDVKLTFVAPGDLLPFWIDNVEVVPVDVTYTNIDDSIRFEYNATNIIKTISIEGTYQDYKKNIYNDHVDIEAYGSILLMKVRDQKSDDPKKDSVPPLLIATVLNYNKPLGSATQESANDKSVPHSSIYPNPVADVLATSITSSKTGNIYLIIYDGSGRVVQSSKYFKNEIEFQKTINVGSLNAGLYYLQAKFSDGSSVIKPFVKH